MPAGVVPDVAVPLEGEPFVGAPLEGVEGCCDGGLFPCCASDCCCDELCEEDCWPLCCCACGTRDTGRSHQRRRDDHGPELPRQTVFHGYLRRILPGLYTPPGIFLC